VNISYNESEKHEPCFSKECSKLLDQRMQNLSQMNGDNFTNVRWETGRLFRNKKGECLKDRIHELEMNSKNKDIKDNYKAINEFKKGYQCSNLFLTLYWMRSVICFSPTVFWVGGRITFVSCFLYMELMISCRLKCIQLSC
jgi:hypothetical protein